MIARPLTSAFVILASLGLAPTPEAVAPATIEVTLTEGTNMAAALSPDGGTLAIDLVGRIWTLPASGGTATALTDPFGDARGLEVMTATCDGRDQHRQSENQASIHSPRPSGSTGATG